MLKALNIEDTGHLEMAHLPDGEFEYEIRFSLGLEKE